MQTGHSACKEPVSVRARRPRPKPLTGSPAIRRAVLLEIDPTPTESQADSLIERVEELWVERQADYHQLVATTASVPNKDLAFIVDDRIRKKREGPTRVIDFPRLRSRHPGSGFDTRICIAICVEKDLSSKVWSRTNLPAAGRRRTRRMEEISRLSELFKRLCAASCDWAAAQVEEALSQSFRGHLRAIPRGAFEVTALGVRDQALAPYFERVSDTDTKAIEILEQSSADELFTRYLEEIADLEGSARQASERPDAFWFSSDVAVEVENGRLESREMLYLMRPTERTAEVVGLGFDDSLAGDLAQRSALKVAKWIANGV